MKIVVSLVHGYKMRLRNSSVFMGCYYIEDDWDLEIIEEDLGSLKKSIAEEVIRSGIDIDSRELCPATYIKYKDHKFVVTEGDDDWEMARKIIDEVLSSSYFLSLKEERAERKILAENQRESAQRMKHIDPLAEAQLS